MDNRTVDRKIHEIIEAEKYIEKQAVELIIMFSDLVGSTHFKATRDAAKGLKRTLIHNEIVSGVMNKNEGEVIKFIGDEVMGQFKSADSALKAAIEINTALKNKPTRGMSTETGKLAHLIEPAVRFYDIALARDDIFFKNLVQSRSYTP